MKSNNVSNLFAFSFLVMMSHFQLILFKSHPGLAQLHAQWGKIIFEVDSLSKSTGF